MPELLRTAARDTMDVDGAIEDVDGDERDATGFIDRVESVGAIRRIGATRADTRFVAARTALRFR